MAADTFSTDQMKSALMDVNTTDGATTHVDKEQHLDKEHALALAREKGWVAPQAYDYETYNAPMGSSAAMAAATEAGQGPLWGHNAVKYEWREEYGEVGPAIPELEDQLFRSEFLVRKGLKFDQYVTALPQPISVGSLIF